MNILNLFRRRAAYAPPVILDPYALKAMHARDYVRSDFTVPTNHGELMAAYKAMAKQFSVAPQDTNDILCRRVELSDLELAATRLFNAGEIAPIGYKKVKENIATWRASLQPAPQRSKVREFFYQLTLNFGG